MPATCGISSAERAGEGQPPLRRDRGERDAGGEHRLLQVAPGGDAQAALVDEGAAALLRPEHLVRPPARRSGRRPAPMPPSGSRRSSPMLIAQCGMPCRKLVVPSSGSTTQRQVQLSRAGGAGFLHQEGVAGPRLVQFLAQRLLGAQVGLARRSRDGPFTLTCSCSTSLKSRSSRFAAFCAAFGHHGHVRRRGGAPSARPPLSPWRAPRSCRPRCAPRCARRSR